MFTRMMLARALALVASTGVAGAAQAVTLFDVDNFSDGLIRGWTNGNGGNGMSVVGGGQGGATDNFLQIKSGISLGFQRKLAGFNSDARYTGDYLAAGATAIRVSIANLSAPTLSMRLLLFDVNGNEWTSTTAATITGNSGWATYDFSIAEANLTQISGTDPYTSSLGSVTRVLLRHQPGAPSDPVADVTATAGFDNIQVVPEPASIFAMVAGLATLLKRNRRSA